MKRNLRLVACAVAGAAGLATFLARGLPVVYAAILGVAIAVLGWAGLNTLDRLREIWRR